jgi:hypothetical protein
MLQLQIISRGIFQVARFASDSMSIQNIASSSFINTHITTARLSFRLRHADKHRMSYLDFQMQSPAFHIAESVSYNGGKQLSKIEAVTFSKLADFTPVVVLDEELPPYDHNDTRGLDVPPPYSPTPPLHVESSGLRGTAATPLTPRPRRNGSIPSSTKSLRASQPRKTVPSSASRTSAESAGGTNMALIAATLAFERHRTDKSKASTELKPPQGVSRRARPMPPTSQTPPLTDLPHPFAPLTPPLPLHLDHKYPCRGVQLPGAWPLD